MSPTNSTGQHTADQQVLDLQSLWQKDDSGQGSPAAAALPTVANGPLAGLQALWNRPDTAAANALILASAGPANAMAPADVTAALIAKLKQANGNN